MNFRDKLNNEINAEYNSAASFATCPSAARFKLIIQDSILSGYFQAECIISNLEEEITKKAKAGQSYTIAGHTYLYPGNFEHRAVSFIEELILNNCQLPQEKIKNIAKGTYRPSRPHGFNLSKTPYFPIIKDLGLILDKDSDDYDRYNLRSWTGSLAITSEQQTQIKALFGIKHCSTFKITPYGQRINSYLFKWAKNNHIRLSIIYRLKADNEICDIEWDGSYWSLINQRKMPYHSLEIQGEKCTFILTDKEVNISDYAKKYANHSFELCSFKYSMTL